jgi:hypothetical protein
VKGFPETWNRCWYGPVIAARPWFFMKITLLLLALDTWLVMAKSGGRYGAGGFNVAHFAWLDALQPVPTQSLYVTVILVCGLLGALCAVGVTGRRSLCALMLLYTYGWAMSQLDSYQHHYLLSWFFLLFIAFPLGTVFSSRKEPTMVSAWAWKLLIAICALLYAYTGVSKLEPAWLAGDVLKRINASGGPLDPLVALGQWVGFSEEMVWKLAGASVVAAQAVIACAYVAVLVAGDRKHRWLKAIRWVGLCSAVGFHAMSEYVGLRIGWFTYYMIALAWVVFLPANWMHMMAWCAQRPWNFFLEKLDASAQPKRSYGPPWLLASVLLAGSTLCAFSAFGDIGLPGCDNVALMAGAVVCVAGLMVLLRGEHGVSIMRALASAVVALMVTVTFEGSQVRYDYYRFVGGDALRRAEYQKALDAYGKANSYAPAGSSRWKKVIQTRKQMAKSQWGVSPP